MTSAQTITGGTSGTIEVGSAGETGSFWIDPNGEDVLVGPAAGVSTVLGTGDAGALNTGTETVLGGTGFFHAGSAGGSLLESAEGIAVGNVTTLIGGGAGDVLISQSQHVLMLGQAGTALIDAAPITLAGGTATVAGQRTVPVATRVSLTAAGALDADTLSAGASNAEIFAAGGDAIIGGSGASTVWGHIGSSGGLYDVFAIMGAGRMTIEDFGSTDTFSLIDAQFVADMTGGGGTASVVTLSDGSSITFPDGFITAQNVFTYFHSGGLNAPCFAAGTRIATPQGDLPVERLCVGDRVRTAAGGAATVRWLGRRTVDCRHHPHPYDVWPVRIRQHAFGPGLPARELRLSPDHAVFAGGVLIPVRYLLNGATIMREPVDTVTYWHIELPQHEVILAEALPCESYLDTGNRAAFSHGGPAVALQAIAAPGTARYSEFNGQ